MKDKQTRLVQIKQTAASNCSEALLCNQIITLFAIILYFYLKKKQNNLNATDFFKCI